MTRDPVCCVPGESVTAAAEIMKNDDVGSVPVTDRDLALEVVAAGKDPRSVTVGEVMKSAVVTCKPTDDVKLAIGKMADQQVRRIPVVEEDGSIVGIIAQSDVATRLEAPEATAAMVEEISR